MPLIASTGEYRHLLVILKWVPPVSTPVKSLRWWVVGQPGRRFTIKLPNEAGAAIWSWWNKL
jgi:hypothetical protein